jgi:regulator of nucleoside diphosphate kinase
VPSGLTFPQIRLNVRLAAPRAPGVCLVERAIMLDTILPAVSIPVRDHARLKRLALRARENGHPLAEPLLLELERATISAGAKPDVVALDQTVTYRADLGAPAERRLLVCPDAFTDPRQHLSVLSPVGVALVGLRVGARFPYHTLDRLYHIAIVEDVGEPRHDGPRAA